MVVLTWVSGRHFLKKKTDELNLSLQGKHLTAFVVNDKIRAFKQRFKYWKNLFATISLIAS